MVPSCQIKRDDQIIQRQRHRAKRRTFKDPIGVPAVVRMAAKNVISRLAVILLSVMGVLLCAVGGLQALRISNFRVPAYVPITLASSGQLSKPILFDCDYDYDQLEDSRLAVKWFKNKEAEPFYQWLPELNVRHFADWIRPLVNQSFVSDPLDPLKRYRSLLIQRLSLNLTGQFTCLVSSLAGQDQRQSSLVIYQPPRELHFEHRIYPAPASLFHSVSSPISSISHQPHHQVKPTQFKGLASGGSSSPPKPVIHPPNNNELTTGVEPAPSANVKIVYTHDGRPIRRKQRQAPPDQQVSAWMLRRKLLATNANATRFVLQLHHFQCQASQVTPRPVIVLTVKREADSIAQYLHESSTVSIRPYQVSQSAADYSSPKHYLSHTSGNLSPTANSSTMEIQVTLYDVTLSATVALNVSLAGPSDSGGPKSISSLSSLASGEQESQQPGVNTVLQYRRGQRMSFECHLEITGTEFEQRKRININDQEVYQFAEAEEEKRRLRQMQQLAVDRRQANPNQGDHREPPELALFSLFGSSGAASPSQHLALSVMLATQWGLLLLLAVLLLLPFRFKAHQN